MIFNTPCKTTINMGYGVQLCHGLHYFIIIHNIQMWYTIEYCLCSCLNFNMDQSMLVTTDIVTIVKSRRVRYCLQCQTGGFITVTIWDLFRNVVYVFCKLATDEYRKRRSFGVQYPIWNNEIETLEVHCI